MIQNRAPIARRDWSSAALAGSLVAAAAWLGSGIIISQQLGARRSFLELQKLWRFLPMAEWPAWAVTVAPAVVALVAGGLVFYAISKEKVRNEWHHSGPQLRKGFTGSARQRKEALFTLASLPFNLDRIRRSILILGSIGGGKTQIIWNLVRNLRKVGFKLLIVDGPKGDYSRTLDRALIVAPWHAGPAWDIAHDCRTRNHARELAKFLIPVSDKDPLWGNAAGMVFVAILCKLQVENGDNWGWREINAHISLPVDQLKNIAATYYPPAVQAVADAESKTTQSIVINLTAFMSDVYEMALAWENAAEKFSFCEWWRSEKGPRTVILQGSGEFQSLAGGYISAIVSTLANLTASPSFSESETRKNVVVIDEMAQLPKLPGVQKFVEIGRSKGCSAILATQSPAQLVEIYSQNTYQAWASMIGTKAIVRINGADDAQVVLREIGEREVYVPANTVTTTAGGQTVSQGWQKEKTETVRADDLRELGPEPRGILAIWLGFGRDPVQVTTGYLDTPQRRPAFIENPDFNRHVINVLTAPAVERTENTGGDENTCAQIDEAVAEHNEYTDYIPEEFLPEMPVFADEHSEHCEEPEVGGELSERMVEGVGGEVLSEIVGVSLGFDPHLLEAALHTAEAESDLSTDLTLGNTSVHIDHLEQAEHLRREPEKKRRRFVKRTTAETVGEHT